MNMKQLLCLLVLAVSGNTFGSTENATAQKPMPEMIDMKMATSHFSSLEQGMPDNHPFITEARKMGKELRWHDDVTKDVVMLIIKAHKQGIIDGLTVTGKYLQTGLTAMGNIITTEQKSMNAMMMKK